MPISAVVDGSAFVHGGLFPGHVAYGLDRVDQEVRLWMLGERDDYPGPVRTTSNSMVWSRIYSEGSTLSGACDLLEGLLAELGAVRLIVGHTTHSEIETACDDVVWRIDNHSAADALGTFQVLEILDGVPTVLEAQLEE
jgi:hypothetical protein